MPQNITFVRSIPLTSALFLMLLPFLILGFDTDAVGQTSSRQNQQQGERKPASDEISGMYTFLREGEFVQFTVEDGKLSGFVSRYGDRDSDRGAFLDQFFSKASLEGHKISFTTKSVHGTWFEFAGDVSRGEAKTPDKEGYWIVRGTLKQYDQDESKQVSAKSRQVVLKSFPQGLEPEQESK